MTRTSKTNEEEDEEITDENKDYLTTDKAYKSIENNVNFYLLNNIDLNPNFNSLKLNLQNIILKYKSKQIPINDFLK